MLRKSAVLALLALCIGCNSHVTHSPPPAASSNPTPKAPDTGKDNLPPPQVESGKSPTFATPPGAKPPLPARPVSRLPARSIDTDPEAVWYEKLKDGLLRQNVPPTMKWKVPSTVTVV